MSTPVSTLAQAWHARALTYAVQGDVNAALESLHQALRLQPDYAEAYHNLGVILARQRRHDEAVAAFREALRLKTDYAQAALHLARVLEEQQKIDEAVAAYWAVLRLWPENAAVHNALGLLLTGAGQTAEAANSFRQALALDPRQPGYHNNLAAALTELRQPAEALQCFEEALRLDPHNAEAHCKLAVVLAAHGKLDEALACYDQALRINPDFAEAHLGRGMALLLAGQFEQGWPEYEWRDRCGGFQASPSQPLWDGSPLAGRTILLNAEQGLGDTLQFIRYAARVKEGGGTVVVACHRPLLPLLASCPGIDRLVEYGATVPEGVEVHARLASLPGIFGTTLATVPASVPYLCADPARVTAWREELAAFKTFKIGIVWQGNPDNPADRWRSVPLLEFAPLADVQGVSLFSLQVGAGREQLDSKPEPRPSGSGGDRSLTVAAEREDRIALTDLGGRFDSGSFADAAAVVMNLDLVITVDTALAHLAGALAVPVFVVLPNAPDWRWLLDREDSPWYPTMRLFRQHEPGNWSAVFQRIAAELPRLVAEERDRFS